MYCSTCGQHRDAVMFYHEPTKRYLASCSECRSHAPMPAKKEPASIISTLPSRPAGLRLLDASVAHSVAFVIDQLREHDRAAKR